MTDFCLFFDKIRQNFELWARRPLFFINFYKNKKFIYIIKNAKISGLLAYSGIFDKVRKMDMFYYRRKEVIL